MLGTFGLTMRGLGVASLVFVAVLVACSSHASTPQEVESPSVVSTPGSPTVVSTPGISAPPSTVPLPAAVDRVLDGSFPTATSGVVLASTPCGTGRCAKFLITSDGGRHFETVVDTAIAAPASGGECGAGTTCVSRVVMVSALHGFAFDPALAETSDGGHTWRLSTDGVFDVAASAGLIFRLAGRPVGCDGVASTLQRRALAGGAWTDVAVTVPLSLCPPQLVVGNPNVVAVVAYGNHAGSAPRAQIVLSADGGSRWHAVDDVCPGGDGYSWAVAVAAPERIVELCGHQFPPLDVTISVEVSENGGQHFGLHSVPQTRVVDSLSLDIVAQGRGIVIDEHGPHGDDVELSADGGAHWRDVLQTQPTQDSRVLGSLDAQTLTVVQSGTGGVKVWTSRDGGSTWISP